jgi:hypothetical protein
MKPSKNTAFHQTQFSKAESSKLMSAASELAKRRREKGQFTNTSTFDLKCLVRAKFLTSHSKRHSKHKFKGLRNWYERGEGSEEAR